MENREKQTAKAANNLSTLASALRSLAMNAGATTTEELQDALSKHAEELEKTSEELMEAM